MAKKAISPIPEEKLRLYDRLVASQPEVERKGAKTPYTSCNGHMFSFLTQEGILALRLDKAEREAFLEKFDTELCEQHGKVMKEYVVVPDTLFAKHKEVAKYFAKSFAYVGSLKPKPTKRTKKT